MNIFKNVKCDYVSFDVFDTLLYRKVNSPEKVHDLTEKELIKIDDKFLGYSKIRLDAEKKAHCSNKTESTIEDIYSNINEYDEKDKKIAMAKELEVEKSVLYPNLLLKQRIIDLQNMGKKIIISSDMYLSTNFIKKLLMLNGIPYDYIFVSSDLQKRKKDGKMFKYILSELQISKDNIIHIGDNKISDYLIPKIIGIKSFLWKKRKYTHHHKYLDIINKDKEYAKLYEFVDKKYCSNYFEEIGYKYFGPVLYGFCKWIDKIKKEENLQSICFLSRDGQIVSKAYEIIFNSKNPYFLASRRALTVPLLENAQNMNDIIKIVPYIKRLETVDSFLTKVGINNNDISKKIKKKYGNVLSRDNLLSEIGDEIYKIIESPMKNNSKEEKKAAISYINLNMKSNKIGIIDIGWYGTMQRCLSNLNDCNSLNKEFFGLYFGLLEKKDKKKIKNAKGFIYDYNLKKFDKDLIYGFNGLIELMFTADHGSAKRYFFNGNKVVCELEKDHGEYCEFVKQVQDGALSFINDFIKDDKINNISLSNDVFIALEDLLINPTKEECSLLGNLNFYDVYFEKIIQFENWGKLFLNPKKSIKRFLNSNWKIGYLRTMGFKNAKTIYKIMNILKG